MSAMTELDRALERASEVERTLRKRIADGQAAVAIVGLGYVGLPLAFALHEGGLPVIGLDVDPEKVNALEKGESYLRHFPSDHLTALHESPRFQATTEFDRMGDADVIVVCVPTPLGPHREPDLSYVIETGKAIGLRARPGQLLVLESTTYPRTTRDEFLPAVLAHYNGGEPLELGENFFVAYSPEREDPGRRDHDTQSIPKLVGGLDEPSTRVAAALYRRGVANVVEVSSAEVAESAKILENVFRSVNIALVNEMKTILDAMDIDIWEVVDAAATKPFGFMPFYPGPGLGGHCIPIDPFYLSWKAKEAQHTTRFIELAGEINTAMPEYVVGRVAAALNDEAKAVRGSSILVLGLAYKPDVDDTRESPAFELIERLIDLGAEVSYHDPYVQKTPIKRDYDLQLSSEALTAETLARADAVLIATNHSAVDYDLVAAHASLIVDTRNAMKGSVDALRGRWVKA